MAKTIENVENAVEVKAAAKKSIFGDAFDKEYSTRVNMVIEDLAPRIIETLETYGLINESGYYFEHQAVTFKYDVLTSILEVDIGANAVLRANLATKKVTVFKNGAWQRVFEQLYETRLVGKDTTGAKRNKEVKIREMIGMSKI
jgi:hypothetical protein